MSADIAPAAMPGEEEIARALHDDLYPPEEARSPADQEKHWLSTEAHYREQAQVVLALFAPILAEKEREIATEKARADRNYHVGKMAQDMFSDAEARALAAEAALAAERERCAKIAEQFAEAHAQFPALPHAGRAIAAAIRG